VFHQLGVEVSPLALEPLARHEPESLDDWSARGKATMSGMSRIVTPPKMMLSG
jgi:hypothetical protein